MLHAGFIQIINKENKSFTYALAEGDDYHQLQNNIQQSLDEILQQLKDNQPNGSLSAHHITKPLKSITSKETKASAQ